MPEESHCAAASSAPIRGLPGATSRPRRLTGLTKSDVHLTRVIERWLPIVEIGIESTCGRTPMTPFPAPNRVHV